jgi:hypothetical protein
MVRACLGSEGLIAAFKVFLLRKPVYIQFSQWAWKAALMNHPDRVTRPLFSFPQDGEFGLGRLEIWKSHVAWDRGWRPHRCL